jgi:transglutaminase-like putative cysteine protease
MVLLAAPLAALLFFVFPRIQGPLWGMPHDAGLGRTGLSNTMAPGNLANLAESEETAFRVRFLDPAPPQSQLYWRGVVLGEFDGRTWTQVAPPANGPQGQSVRASVAGRGRVVRHRVTLEPSGQRWLFALDLPEQLPQLAGNPSSMSAELELRADYPIEERVRYDASSTPSYGLQAGAALADAERWLALPERYNPRALEAGAVLARQPDPRKRVNTVLRAFHDDGFSYTQEPPLLGRDSVDDFLYRTKAGFCEHYASAFVFLMRAAGVPARVVTGYQGGELNPVDGFVTVRQSDAHAWAEVWLAGRGWLRVDPTAAVAPERVQRSRARARGRENPFGQLDNFETGRNSFLSQLRFGFAALDNRWNQWVLNYTPERQQRTIESLKAGLANWTALAAIAGAALLMALARTLGERRRIDPVDALYSALCGQLGRLGLARGADEGPNDYRERIERARVEPRHKTAAAEFLRLYSAYKYGAQTPPARLTATLKKLLTKFR